MKRTVFLICLICISFVKCTCNPDIEDNQRSSFSGSVTDENNNPLSNVDVHIMVSDLNLGTSSTSELGIFNFISLVSSFTNYSAEFNPSSSDSDFSNFKVNYFDRNIVEFNDLGTIIIPRKTRLEIQFKNVSNRTASINLSIEYKIAECNNFDENNAVLDYTNCLVTELYSNEVIPGTPLIGFEVNSVQGTIAVLTYRIGDDQSLLVPVPLSENQVIYEITY